MPFGTTPIGPIKINKSALKLLGDDQLVLDTARAYTEANVAVAPGSGSYTLGDKKDAFAKVNIGLAEGGGYWAILKKVNGIWVVILTGQDVPGKEDAKKYGLPQGWFSTEY